MDNAARPEDLLGAPMPELGLQDPEGRPFPVRQFVDQKPLVLFFVIRSATPG